MAGGGVFGDIQGLDQYVGTSAFIVMCLILLVLEIVLHQAEHFAHKYGYEDLYEKLVKELMILGIISFTSFVVGEAFKVVADVWFVAVHFVHILTLFIGLAFILQAFFFLMTSYLFRVRLKQTEFMTPADVILIHDGLRDMRPSQYHRFLTTPQWKQDALFFLTPSTELKDIIESKLFGLFFKTRYRLPPDFSFSEYIGQSYKKYVIELADVSPLTWIIVIIFTALNYIRIVAFDSYATSKVCPEYSQDEAFVESNSFGCATYSLVLFLCGILAIIIFNASLLTASVLYYHRVKVHIYSAFQDIEDQLGICAAVRDTSSAYFGLKLLRRYLLTMGLDLSPEYHIVASGILPSSASSPTPATQNRPASIEVDARQLDAIKSEMSQGLHSYFARQEELSRSQQQPSALSLGSSLARRTIWSRVKRVMRKGWTRLVRWMFAGRSYLARERSVSVVVHSNINTTISTSDGRQQSNKYKDEDADEEYRNEMNSCFLFASPLLYFQAIELSLLCQSIFAALFFTQYIAISANHTSKGWLIAFIVIILINYMLIHWTLQHANSINCLVYVDTDLIEDMKDEVLEKRLVRDKLQDLVLASLNDDLLIPPEGQRKFVRKKFSEAAQLSKNGSLNEHQFAVFLQSLGVYYSNKLIKRAFKVIDYNRDYGISWVEIADLLFTKHSDLVRDGLSIHKLWSEDLKADHVAIMEDIQVRRNNTSSSSHILVPSFLKASGGIVAAKKYESSTDLLHSTTTTKDHISHTRSTPITSREEEEGRGVYVDIASNTREVVIGGKSRGTSVDLSKGRRKVSGEIQSQHMLQQDNTKSAHQSSVESEYTVLKQHQVLRSVDESGEMSGYDKGDIEQGSDDTTQYMADDRHGNDQHGTAPDLFVKQV